MPWKEPGEKPSEPRGREPWGQGDRGNGGGPDLDAWLQGLRRRLGPFGRGPLGVVAVLVLAVALWFAIGGWVAVGPQQVGVVLRFGRLAAVLQPGLHFRLPPPIDHVRIVDLQRVRDLSDDVRLLTGDGQLVLLDYDVQYRVGDARMFLFASRDAEATVRNVATVTMRALVGTHALADLLDRDDGALANAARTRIAAAVAEAGVGIVVTGVTVQHAAVPAEAKQAFDAIDKAREDAKAAQVAASAEVARQKVDTQAKLATIASNAAVYRAKAEADAKADAARFAAVLPQYQAAPQVTRHRLWLDTLHEVLSRNHVVVNTGTGNVIVQFPPRQADAAHVAPSTSAAPAAAEVPASAASGSAPATSGPLARGDEA